MSAPLRFLSESTLRRLRDSIGDNRERYANGSFSDLSDENGWAVESKLVKVDYDALSSLDGSTRSADADVANSKILHAALSGMTPAVAADERIWVRLTHVECLEYSRSRWLSGETGDDLLKAIRKHMFAAGVTGIRDDNALSRLWWNMHIASIADPDDPDGALGLIVKRADIRMQFVERPGSAARRAVARGVVRAMRRDPWILSHDDRFDQFMKALNRNGGGILFEARTEADIDSFLDDCVSIARLKLGETVGNS